MLIMDIGWGYDERVWQVLLQLFHGGVHMEPAGPTQGWLSLRYQSFEFDANFEFYNLNNF